MKITSTVGPIISRVFGSRPGNLLSKDVTIPSGRGYLDGVFAPEGTVTESRDNDLTTGGYATESTYTPNKQ